MAKLTIYDRLWIQKSACDWKNNRDLAYVTYIIDDENFQKRQKTGRRWASYGSVEIPASETTDNDWREGFTIKSVASRYSTDNKVWRIRDPRGFEVEIQSGNLLELLQESMIAEGEIKAPCKWAFYGGRIYLTAMNTESAREAEVFHGTDPAKKPKPLKLSELKPGYIYSTKSGECWLYGGRHRLNIEAKFLFDAWKESEAKEVRKTEIVTPTGHIFISVNEAGEFHKYSSKVKLRSSSNMMNEVKQRYTEDELKDVILSRHIYSSDRYTPEVYAEHQALNASTELKYRNAVFSRPRWYEGDLKVIGFAS